MKRFVFVAAMAFGLAACCSKKDAPASEVSIGAGKTTTPATATTTVTARPCSAMPTAGDCTACCGAHKASFRGPGTCRCD